MTPQELLAQSRALLLDFDGPVCSVFAGISASVVADQLRAVLVDGGHAELPDDVATADDPFDVFRYAATLGDDEARYVEAAFTAHEVEAVTSAATTPGAHELMRDWHQSGRPLAIVSNNSVAAISVYLDLYDLRHLVDYVSARNGHDPKLLKPSPYLLDQAVSALRAIPEACTLIGDSLTDIQAARAFGVWVLGYANKSGKRAKFTNVGADFVVDRLTNLVVSNDLR